MELSVLGINHKTAPIEIRECLAFKPEDLDKALAGAQALPSVKENMILSTCNRVEIYAVSREEAAGAFELRDFLSRFHHLPLEKFGDCIYLRTGNEAVRHIFRVASSLDSLVVGEPQILGQIKSAYEAAVRCQTSGVILHRLLHGAFHVAKRVRTETGIGNSAVSVSSVAVDLARKIFETLEDRIALLIGAGEMCELAAQHLVSGGVRRVLVANRTFERACLLAQKFQGEAVPFEQIQEGLRKADIVISATDSGRVLLEKDSVARIMKERRHRPIFFIDIADPRNIDARVNDIENVYLYNIDHLQKIARDHLRDREKEAQKAEAIVLEEAGKFVGWYRSLALTPTIVALRGKFEEIRRRELEKALSRLPHLSDREKNALEALASGIVNKILHPPLASLKKAEADGLADAYLDALQGLFQLTIPAPEPASKKPEEDEGPDGGRFEPGIPSREGQIAGDPFEAGKRRG